MKKVFSLVLALLMLALPVLGQAEDDFDAALAAGRQVNAEISFELGGALLAMDESLSLVKDVLDVLKIKVYQHPEDQTGFALELSGQDALTVDYMADEKTNYLASNLLGAAPVALATEDVPAFIVRLIDLFAAMGAVSADQAAEIKGYLDMAGQTLELSGMPLMGVEQLEALDFSPVEALLESYASVSEVTMQPRNSDPAVQVKTYTLDGEKLAAVTKAVLDVFRADANVMKAIDDAMAAQNLTGAQFFDMAEQELLPELAKIYPNEVPMFIYLNEQGEAVAVNCNAGMQPEGEEAVNLEMNYARLTVNDALTHSATLLMGPADEMISVTLNVIEKGADASVNLSLNVEGIVLGAAVETVTANAGTPDVATEATIALSIDDETLLTVRAKVAAVQPGAPMDPAAALPLMEISDEEFQNWFMDVVNGAFTWLMSCVQLLPESVLMLLFQ